MGVDSFGPANNDKLAKMDRQLNAAASKDCKWFKKGDRVKKVVMATMKGDEQAVQLSSMYHGVMLKWVGIIHKKYTGIIIQCTVNSVDNTGTCISTLTALQEHHLVVCLYQHKMDNLDELVEDIVEFGMHRTAMASVNSISIDFFNTTYFLHNVNNKLEPNIMVVTASDNNVTTATSLPCDKIVVYYAFPTSYIQLRQVSAL
jgi:hypothetical protein